MKNSFPVNIRTLSISQRESYESDAKNRSNICEEVDLQQDIKGKHHRFQTNIQDYYSPEIISNSIMKSGQKSKENDSNEKPQQNKTLSSDTFDKIECLENQDIQQQDQNQYQGLAKTKSYKNWKKDNIVDSLILKENSDLYNQIIPFQSQQQLNSNTKPPLTKHGKNSMQIENFKESDEQLIPKFKNQNNRFISSLSQVSNMFPSPNQPISVHSREDSLVTQNEFLKAQVVALTQMIEVLSVQQNEKLNQMESHFKEMQSNMKEELEKIKVQQNFHPPCQNCYQQPNSKGSPPFQTPLYSNQSSNFFIRGNHSKDRIQSNSKSQRPFSSNQSQQLFELSSSNYKSPPIEVIKEEQKLEDDKENANPNEFQIEFNEVKKNKKKKKKKLEKYEEKKENDFFQMQTVETYEQNYESQVPHSQQKEQEVINQFKEVKEIKSSDKYLKEQKKKNQNSSCKCLIF